MNEKLICKKCSNKKFFGKYTDKPYCIECGTFYKEKLKNENKMILTKKGNIEFGGKKQICKEDIETKYTRMCKAILKKKKWKEEMVNWIMMAEETNIAGFNRDEFMDEMVRCKEAMK